MSFKSMRYYAVFAIFFSLLPLRAASAYSFYDAHDARQYTRNVFSAFTYVYTGQLLSQCRLGDPYSFINNEMWRNDAGGRQWTEMGDTDGEVNGTCWNGGYIGYVDTYGTYHEATVGTFAPWVGWHSYEMTVSSANYHTVVFYYNGIYYGTAYMANTFAGSVEAGIESNSSIYGHFNYFVSGSTAAGSMQVYSGGSAWYYWPLPTPFGAGAPEVDQYYPTVYSTYGWQKSGGPIINYYHR